MTKRIFWDDPYQTRHHTRIATVEGSVVTVEETIFFAFSGGQEGDAGTLGGHPVLTATKHATKTGQTIEYTLPDNHGLQVGDAVAVEIDWTRRYQLMRLHFAAELVLELVYQQLGKVNKIGAHIAQDKSRLDFELPHSIAPLLPELTDAANTIIASNIAINKGFSDEAKQLRFWKIDGFSPVPCGGTHLDSTGEVGSIRLKRKNIGKGKERIDIYLV